MVVERPSVVALVGMMGSGKTTIGRLLADRLGVAFGDTDEVVVRQANCSIAELFASSGEEAFRDLEAKALADCLDRGGVVATGGGVVLREGNRELLMRDGVYVVWLDSTIDGLHGRLSQVGDRPLLGDNPREALLHLDRFRRPLYSQVTSIRIDTTSKSPEEICDAVLVGLVEQQ